LFPEENPRDTARALAAFFAADGDWTPDAAHGPRSRQAFPNLALFSSAASSGRGGEGLCVAGALNRRRFH
jgi:hypothetical protein